MGPTLTVLHSGLPESSPEEPKMHQNSWRRGICPGPHWGSSQRSRNPLAVGEGGKPPLQEPGSPDSAIRASSFISAHWASPRLRNVDFVPTTLLKMHLSERN